MAQHTLQFQKGLSWPDFLKEYGTEEQCEQTLERWRWPQGFICPSCGGQHAPVRLRTRALWQCRHCHHQASLTAGTLFEATKLPLTTWFLAMFLLTPKKNGISALELKRHLGVSYLTAWRIKHKLLQVMKERDDQTPLSGVIEVDDAYWGGERHGAKPGRGCQTRCRSSLRSPATTTATPSACASAKSPGSGKPRSSALPNAMSTRTPSC
jgi:hypothetical protein